MQANADGTLKKGAGKLDKSNVKDNLGKKEAGKKKPKGVKVMPDKGVTGSEKTIKESIEEAKNKKYVVFDKARGENASKAFDTKEEAEAELKKINAEDPEHGDYVIDVNENIEEIKKKVINKYINIEIEDDGEEFPVLNKKSISDYLKSVIDPSEIKAVNSFMRDEEGFDESASYFFEDIGDTEISDTTEQEVEDWAKQEMSYYLFSEPDEFPSKELEEEFRPGRRAPAASELGKVPTSEGRRRYLRHIRAQIR
jgi:hypothetical protein